MKKGTRIIGALAAVVGVIGVITALADPVAPANLQLTCLRTTQQSGNVTTTVYWQGDTISFTNSVMYTGATTNTAVQNLDGCSITVVMGSLNSTSVVTAAGSVISTNDGTWSAEMEVPDFNPCYIQVSVSNQSVFTYPLYRISTQSKLGE